MAISTDISIADWQICLQNGWLNFERKVLTTPMSSQSMRGGATALRIFRTIPTYQLISFEPE